MFLVIKYAGAAYLLYIAYKIWTAPAVAKDVTAEERAEHPARLLLGGLALTLGNPKTIVFYLALLPTILDLTRITVLGFAELVGGDLDRAGRGLCGLYRACRPRPAALYDAQGHPDPQPDHRRHAGGRRGRHCVTLTGTALRPRFGSFGRIFRPFFTRAYARGGEISTIHP